MGDPARHVRVAVVQAAPVFLDREASTAKAIGFIEEAGREGVDVLAFPEGFIPAHPVWYHFHPATGEHSLELGVRLFQNSVEIPGPTTDALCRAAAEARVNVVIGVCERRPRTTGTMFNTQLFIDDAGRILGRHRKLTPTNGERLVHAGGYGDGLRVYETSVGRVSGLICGENSNPLAIFALAAQDTEIHVASWPNHSAPHENSMADTIAIATRSLSYKCGCFVLNACGIVSPEMQEELPYTDADRVFLDAPGTAAGGSSIIGADSKVIRGPLPSDQEGMLVADIDLADCIKAKLIHDYAGHYNRADVFSLHVDRAIPELFHAAATPEEDAVSERWSNEGSPGENFLDAAVEPISQRVSDDPASDHDDPR